MGAISEGKAALELTRELVSYLKKAGEHDPKLMGMFEDLREKVLALYESDIELRQQVRELEEKLNLREDIVFDRSLGAYYTGTLTNRKDGPFCAKCFHEEKGLVPMASSIAISGGGTMNYVTGEQRPVKHHSTWICPLCSTVLYP